MSMKVKSVFCVPGEVENIWSTSKTLSPVLDIPRNTLIRRMTRQSRFSWIKRKCSDEETRFLLDHPQKGVYLVDEVKRFYPKGHLLSHVLGFVNIDNEGIEGIEYALNEHLKGRLGKARIQHDARGREILAERFFLEEPVNGANVVLTIDEVIQNIAEEELQKLVEAHAPLGASVVVMDVRTGELLAVSNRPTFDLNEFTRTSSDQRKNRAFVNAYEPGSLFKVVTAAAALNERVTTLDEVIFCEHGAYRVAGQTLNDSHAFDSLSFAEIIAKSSNIGFAKVAFRLKPESFYRYIREFGFGTPTGIALAGEASGRVWHYRKWSGYSPCAIAMGHEVTATPVQMAAAISTVANGGIRIAPKLVARIEDPENGGYELSQKRPPEKRILRPEVSRKLSRALEMVVSEEGTAPDARIEGIPVAGKTGTSQKIVDGRYSHSKHVSSFYGFLPADDPRVSITIMVDEPRGKTYGGEVAGPAFSAIGERVMHYLFPRPLASIRPEQGHPGEEKTDAA
jgi:cell division protein FtsI (penicillin-binding protein 3)